MLTFFFVYTRMFKICAFVLCFHRGKHKFTRADAVPHSFAFTVLEAAHWVKTRG